MNHLEDAGAPLQAFPRTISFANWPFLAFLVFLAGALAILPAMQGNWLIAAGMVGAVAIFPAGVAMIVLLTEVVGRRTLHSIHEHGIVWRRGWMRGFIPWNDLAAVHALERDDDGSTTRYWEVQDRYPGTETIAMPDGMRIREGAELIASKITR